ncbi:MAG: universal stress protein [Nitrososphaerota archaeon]
MSFRRILVAVDGSEISQKTAEYAAKMAKWEGAELHIVHIIPRPPYSEGENLAQYYEEGRKSAKIWLKDLEGRVSRFGLTPEVRIIVDSTSVVDALLGYIEQYEIDLAVTGTRGLSSSERRRTGSVASGIVEYAPCSVLVIRPPKGLPLWR